MMIYVPSSFFFIFPSRTHAYESSADGLVKSATGLYSLVLNNLDPCLAANPSVQIKDDIRSRIKTFEELVLNLKQH